MLICTYEDRPADFIGVKLLVASLGRHLPDVPIHVACPAPDEGLRKWLLGRPNVVLDTAAAPGLRGWNVKAGLLLRLIDAGHREVIWIDSDVIVAGDFRPLIADTTSVIVTQEKCWNGPKDNMLRTRGWNLPVGRKLPDLINSAFLRVTSEHRPLLLAWIALMKTEIYQEAQTMPFERRPIHLISDQDVLGAVLGSQEFAHLPVRFLARGRDIIHDFQGGYSASDRISNLFRAMPPLVHAQGHKPWRFPDKPRLIREPRHYYRFTQVESSPYSYLARQYRHALPEFPAFFEVRSLPGKMLGALSLHNLHIHGLPHALLDRGVDRIDRLKALARRFVGFGRRIRQAFDL
ncbi:MAG TPA: hypothetical protein VH374_23085 [Polyangia bacterium]|jgi:hypothetical protein|nr:hypothetical protein [Polyangia bacterium]